MVLSIYASISTTSSLHFHLSCSVQLSTSCHTEIKGAFSSIPSFYRGFLPPLSSIIGAPCSYEPEASLFGDSSLLGMHASSSISSTYSREIDCPFILTLTRSPGVSTILSTLRTTSTSSAWVKSPLDVRFSHLNTPC